MKPTGGEKVSLQDRFVHFVVGFVIGSLVGLAVWLFFLQVVWGWLAIPLIGLAMGTAAAIMGERFWESWFGNG